jgi:hypothetical protein
MVVNEGFYELWLIKQSTELCRDDCHCVVLTKKIRYIKIFLLLIFQFLVILKSVHFHIAILVFTEKPPPHAIVFVIVEKTARTCLQFHTSAFVSG